MKLYEKLGLSIDEFRSLLVLKLNNDESMVTIAKEFQVSPAAIHTWMKKFNIQRRGKLRSKEWLEEQYCALKRSAEEIAKELKVSPPAVTWYLNKYGIQKRTRSEVQKIANVKRSVSPLHIHGSHRSRGYCFRYKGLYCRSIPELMWLLEHRSNFERIVWEPFVFQNHRPDALLDDVVYEIKATKSAMKQSELDRYDRIGENIKAELGYDYQIVFMRDNDPKKYHELLAEAKARGARRGQEGNAIDWD